MAYEIQEISVKFANLPFHPKCNDIIYMESTYDEMINRCIRKHKRLINKKINEGRLIYLPDIYREMTETLTYNAPYLTATEKKRSVEQHRMGSDILLDYMANAGNRGKIGPCFLKCEFTDEETDPNNNVYIFNGFAFKMDSPADAAKAFSEIFDSFEYDEEVYANMYEEVLFDGSEYRQQRTKTPEELEEERRAKIIEELMEEIEDRVKRLRREGVSEWALKQLIEPERRLSRLVITADMHIVLPDYNDMKIVLEPIVMAVYLLFLRHPEGIVFKTLPDYRPELTALYIKVCSRRDDYTGQLSPRQQRSIDNVTNPLSNSINEKCARIKAAFLSKFAEYLASDYYITGLRGEPKRIMLPREMVEFTEG